MKRLPAWAVLGTLALLGAGAASRAEAPHATSQIEPGLWELRDVDSKTPPLRLCLADPRLLLQPFQQGPLCAQFVSEDSVDHVTISYDCGARGQGHTALRIETPRLVQVDSQGITGGRPFAGRMEGRRVGSCTPEH